MCHAKPPDRTMRAVGLWTATLSIVGQCWISGCAASATSPGNIQRRHAAIRMRAELEYSSAVFFKPDEPSLGTPAGDLAPLIVQQVLSVSPAAVLADRFGLLHTSAPGHFNVDKTRPVIYWSRRTTEINGQSCEQTTYLWSYDSEDGSQIAAMPSFQGVRITLDAAGFPCIWEVLNDDSGLRLIFVSSAVERAAAQQHGPPLPGRRFSVERCPDQHPNVVVPRLLDDGPVPMGPWVYLEAGTRSVTTLLCRCSPSQVDDFVESTYYELMPLEAITLMGIDVSAATGGIGSATDRLAQVLRLPSRL